MNLQYHWNYFYLSKVQLIWSCIYLYVSQVVSSKQPKLELMQEFIMLVVHMHWVGFTDKKKY